MQEYPEEDVEMDILDVRDQRGIFVVSAEVSHDSYGKTRVSYSFPKGQGWQEKLDGTEKFMLKLKDTALDRLTPTNDSREIEKKKMEEKRLSESETV